MVLRIKNRIISLIQLLLVLIYIVFEELIWEGIAKPIYELIHSLKILQKIEYLLKDINATFILVIFVLLLASVEVLGIYAGILFMSGKIMLGATLYISKIPIAAFTFWLFRVTEEKLMQFGWFKWMYDYLMRGIDWLKDLEIYKDTMIRIKKAKESLKIWKNKVKQKYFKEESPFMKRMKKHYENIKNSLDK